MTSSPASLLAYSSPTAQPGPQPAGAAPGLLTSNAHPTLAMVERAIVRRSYCVLASVSPTGRPHAAGVIYAMVDGDLWVSVDGDSRKARNIAANGRVHVQIPVRRGPVGPPSSIQFAAVAELVSPDDPTVRRLVADKRLTAITSHGELERPGAALVRIRPGRVLHTYGLGLSLLKLIREPLRAAGRVERPSA